MSNELKERCVDLVVEMQIYIMPYEYITDDPRYRGYVERIECHVHEDGTRDYIAHGKRPRGRLYSPLRNVCPEDVPLIEFAEPIVTAKLEKWKEEFLGA